jgi:hypothetical protein
VFYVLVLLALCSYGDQWYGILALKLSTSRVGGDRVSEKNSSSRSISGGSSITSSGGSNSSSTTRISSINTNSIVV